MRDLRFQDSYFVSSCVL